MNNFEGGSPMVSSTTIQPTRTVPQPVSVAPQTQEISLVREQEVSLVHNNELQTNARESIGPRKNLADRLLEDSKQMGITDTLKRLSSGEYRKDDSLAIHESDSNLDGEVEDHADTHEDENTQSENELSEKDTVDSLRSEKERAKKQKLVSYVIDQTNDPQLQQKLGEVAQEMLQNNGEIDQDKLKEEALRRYTEGKEEQPISLQDRILRIEEQYADLLNKNEELQGQIAEFKILSQSQSETIQYLAIALMELAKKLHEEEEEEKEKLSLLELLIQLVGAMLQEMATPPEQEGKNVTTPPTK